MTSSKKPKTPARRRQTREVTDLQDALATLGVQNAKLGNRAPPALRRAIQAVLLAYAEATREEQLLVPEGPPKRTQYGRHDGKEVPPGHRPRGSRLLPENKFVPASEDDRAVMLRILRSVMNNLAGDLWLDALGERRLRDELDPLLEAAALSPNLGALYRPELEAIYRACFGHDLGRPPWVFLLENQVRNNVLWAAGERWRVANSKPPLPPADYPPEQYGATERFATGAQILSYVARMMGPSPLPPALTAEVIESMCARTGVNAGGNKKLAETVVKEFLSTISAVS